jgi:hypothetical protein
MIFTFRRSIKSSKPDSHRIFSVLQMKKAPNAIRNTLLWIATNLFNSQADPYATLSYSNADRITLSSTLRRVPWSASHLVLARLFDILSLFVAEALFVPYVLLPASPIVKPFLTPRTLCSSVIRGSS